jgi:hypothetical protein
MSYDVSIGDKSFNMTWNVAPMFYDHIPMRDARGGLSEIDGKTGKEAFAILKEAFDRIEETRHKFWKNGLIGEQEFCAKYDAPNGWGSAVGAILFLAIIMAACAENPRKLVRAD